MNQYRIKPLRDGTFDLLLNAEWLGNFQNKEDAETERDHRLRFDSRDGGKE